MSAAISMSRRVTTPISGTPLPASNSRQAIGVGSVRSLGASARSGVIAAPATAYAFPIAAPGSFTFQPLSAGAPLGSNLLAVPGLAQQPVVNMYDISALEDERGRQLANLGEQTSQQETALETHTRQQKELVNEQCMRNIDMAKAHFKNQFNQQMTQLSARFEQHKVAMGTTKEQRLMEINKRAVMMTNEAKAAVLQRDMQTSMQDIYASSVGKK